MGSDDEQGALYRGMYPDAGALTPERLDYLRKDLGRFKIEYGGETRPEVVQRRFNPEGNSIWDLAGAVGQRLAIEPLESAVRVGDALRGKSEYRVDEINDPKTVTAAMVNDAMQGVGIYAGGGILRGRPNPLKFGERTQRSMDDVLANEAGMVEAWHSSPYKFDKMSAEKIGTGEGSQSFGHGLYFTGKESIRDYYYEKFLQDTTRSMDFSPSEQETVNMLQNRMAAKLSIDEAKSQTLKWAESNPQIGKEVAEKALLKLEEKQSSVSKYKAELFPGKDPSEYTFLDWYEPVGKDKINKIIEVAKEDGLKIASDYSNALGHVSGYDAKKLYQDLSLKLGSDKEASVFLKRAGIDGIRYPTETLSGKGQKGGGAYNYVVFDDKDVRLVSRESGGKVEPIMY